MTERKKDDAPRWRVEEPPVIPVQISPDGLFTIAKAFATVLPGDFPSERIAMNITDMLVDLCQRAVSTIAFDKAIEKIRAGDEAGARGVLGSA